MARCGIAGVSVLMQQGHGGIKSASEVEAQYEDNDKTLLIKYSR